VNISLRSRINN